MRILTFLFGISCLLLARAQTYFYIDQIAVVPASPTASDNVSLQLIGNLSSTGAYIVSASAQVSSGVVTLSVIANDLGGLTVLVPHTETITLGQLPAGDYTIVLSAASQGVLDLAPASQHAFSVGGGDPCANLTIASVRWHAFTDTAIVVHVQNSNLVPELFDYPNFILFDAEGDTLAKETVNFFGIGEESWHVLRVMAGSSIPLSQFLGRLELWTGFTTVLSCSWDMTFDLCPPAPCATLYPSIGNFGGAIITATYSWTIHDASNIAASGTFSLSATQQMDADTICLPPGNYFMEVGPNGPPVGGNPMYMVQAAGQQATVPWPVVWSLPVWLEFNAYAPCIEGTNRIADTDDDDWVLVHEPSAIVLRRLSGGPVGNVTVTDALGRMLAQATPASNEARIPWLGPGLVIVHAAGRTWKAAR